MALIAAEEGQSQNGDEEEDNEDISQSQNHPNSEDANDQDNPHPSKRPRHSKKLSMDDEETAFAQQFRTNLHHISEEEQEPVHGDDLMDKSDDLETNIFGGGESNGVCCLFYHILSTQFFSI
jgi:hypothetical protein